MAVTSTTNRQTFDGDSSETVFAFTFVGVSSSDISVIYTTADGTETILDPSVYTLALNAALPGALWGIGGTVTYPLTGSPIASGTTLTVVRELPYTQEFVLSNQGAFYPQVVEQALDYITMLTQQLQDLNGRAIVQPIVDTVPLSPLPPAAQRASQALIFTSTGDVGVGTIPASGVISSAMQPVVAAASLGAGRTAFGLGNMAVENIGVGLQDDGSGNVRVDSSISQVSTNQSPVGSSHRKRFIATGALTFTLARANALWSGYEFWVYALTAAITFAPNASDSIAGGASGASYVIPAGSVCRVTTDAASSGSWYVETTLIATPSAPALQMVNVTLVPSVSGNALTVAIKTLLGNDPSPGDPAFLLFRNPTVATGNWSVVTLTSATSFVVSSGSTFGTINSTAFKIWVVAFNDAGTCRLGGINCLSGTTIYPLGRIPVASSTAEGGAGGADSAQVFYTGAAVTSKAYAILGYMTWETGLAAAGTWTAAPTRVQLFGAGTPLPGDTIQFQGNATGAVATGTTVMPIDDTIPQNTEGDQFMTQSITPTSAAHVLDIRHLGNYSYGGSGASCGFALFQDSTAGALAAMLGLVGIAQAAIALSYRMLAGTTSATTFKIRAGQNTGGSDTVTFNGIASARKLGGVLASRLDTTEICT